eukprot:9486738-Pyramimonas_sp.AAC.1
MHYHICQMDRRRHRGGWAGLRDLGGSQCGQSRGVPSVRHRLLSTNGLSEHAYRPKSFDAGFDTFVIGSPDGG